MIKQIKKITVAVGTVCPRRGWGCGQKFGAITDNLFLIVMEHAVVDNAKGYLNNLMFENTIDFTDVSFYNQKKTI